MIAHSAAESAEEVLVCRGCNFRVKGCEALQDSWGLLCVGNLGISQN